MPSEDRRNVLDKYKGIINEAIIADLDKKRHPVCVAMEHWEGDFNIGTLIRNANAFLAKEVFYIGKRQWDRRGAVGTHHYTHVTHLLNFDGLPDNAPIIGFDNVDGAKNIMTYSFPEKCTLLFGEEANGLSDDAKKICKDIIYIPQWGSVRSLNAGTASGIALFAWAQQHGNPTESTDRTIDER